MSCRKIELLRDAFSVLSEWPFFGNEERVAGQSSSKPRTTGLMRDWAEEDTMDEQECRKCREVRERVRRTLLLVDKGKECS